MPRELPFSFDVWAEGSRVRARFDLDRFGLRPIMTITEAETLAATLAVAIEEAKRSQSQFEKLTGDPLLQFFGRGAN